MGVMLMTCCWSGSSEYPAEEICARFFTLICWSTWLSNACHALQVAAFWQEKPALCVLWETIMDHSRHQSKIEYHALAGWLHITLLGKSQEMWSVITSPQPLSDCFVSRLFFILQNQAFNLVNPSRLQHNSWQVCGMYLLTGCNWIREIKGACCHEPVRFVRHIFTARYPRRTCEPLQSKIRPTRNMIDKIRLVCNCVMIKATPHPKSAGFQSANGVSLGTGGRWSTGHNQYECLFTQALLGNYTCRMLLSSNLLQDLGCSLNMVWKVCGDLWNVCFAISMLGFTYPPADRSRKPSRARLPDFYTFHFQPLSSISSWPRLILRLRFYWDSKTSAQICRCTGWEMCVWFMSKEDLNKRLHLQQHGSCTQVCVAASLPGEQIHVRGVFPRCTHGYTISGRTSECWGELNSEAFTKCCHC